MSIPLKEILLKSSILTIGRVLGVVANLIFTLIITRNMSQSDVGIVMILMSSIMIFSMFVTMNIESGSIRYLLYALEKGEIDYADGFIKFSKNILWLLLPFASIAYYFYLKNTYLSNISTNIVIISILSIALFGWIRMTSQHLTVLSKQLHGSLPSLLLRPLLLALFTLILLFFDVKLTSEIILIAFFVSLLFVSVIQYTFVRELDEFRVDAVKNIKTDKYKWILTGFHLSPSLFFGEYYQFYIISISAFLVSTDEIAVLAVSFKIVTFLNFGLIAVNSSIIPRLTKAIANNDVLATHKLLRLTTHLKLWPLIIASTIIVFLSEELLHLFGPEYVQGKTVVQVLLLIAIIRALLGSNEMILNCTGNQRYIFYSQIISLVFVTALLLFVDNYSLLGISVCATLGVLSSEILLFLMTKKILSIDASFLNLFPLNFSNYKY